MSASHCLAASGCTMWVCVACTVNVSVCVILCVWCVCVWASKCCQLLQSGKRKRNETVAGIAINHLCSSLALTHPDTHKHTHAHLWHTQMHTGSAVMLCTKWHKSTYTPTQTESENERESDAGTCLQSYAELARVSQRNTQQKNWNLTRFALPPHVMPQLPPSRPRHTLLWECMSVPHVSFDKHPWATAAAAWSIQTSQHASIPASSAHSLFRSRRIRSL